MAIPSVKVFASLALKPKSSRWANIIFGIVYTIAIVILATMPGTWLYYLFLGAVEAALTLSIVLAAARNRA